MTKEKQIFMAESKKLGREYGSIDDITFKYAWRNFSRACDESSQDEPELYNALIDKEGPEYARLCLLRSIEISVKAKQGRLNQ